MAERHLTLTDAEWRRIERVLPQPKRGCVRQDDRAMVEALLDYETHPVTAQEAAEDHGLKPAALRTRLRVWRADGTLARVRVMAAGALERDRRRRLRKLGYADPDSAMAKMTLAFQR